MLFWVEAPNLFRKCLIYDFLAVFKHVLKTVLAPVDPKRYYRGKTSSSFLARFFRFYFFHLLLNTGFVLKSVF